MARRGDRSRNPSHVSGWVLVVGSAIALAVGIGVGARGVRAGDVDTSTVLGLVGLVAGIVTLLCGVARVLDRMALRGRIVGGVALFAGVGIVVWTITPAVIAVSVPEVGHDGRSPEQYGLEVNEVSFHSGDGAELWAWYVPPVDRGVVIVRHGSGSTASSVLGHASVLVDHGFGVLLTDARGHGNSGGEGMDFGWFGTDDIGAAVDFLVGRPEVEPHPIAVLGLSMGGEEAIGAIGDDPRISAIVAEGATARTDADKAWLSDVYGWRGWAQERLEWVQYSLTDLLTAASEPESLASSARRADPRPILLVAGGEMPDEIHAAAYMSADAPNVDVWVVPGAGHVAGLAIAPEDWEEVVVGFLERALGR